MSEARLAPYRYCELGHLLTLRIPPLPFPVHYGHIHDGEALQCAVLVAQGWPDAGVIADLPFT